MPTKADRMGCGRPPFTLKLFRWSWPRPVQPMAPYPRFYPRRLKHRLQHTHAHGFVNPHKKYLKHTTEQKNESEAQKLRAENSHRHERKVHVHPPCVLRPASLVPLAATSRQRSDSCPPTAVVSPVRSPSVCAMTSSTASNTGPPRA